MFANGPILAELFMTLPFVDRIYVINLKERTDRRRAIRREFTRVGWNPDDSDICFFDAVKPDDKGPFPSIGAHGCFLSHLGVLDAATAEGLGAIAIFEDDLDFDAAFETRLPPAAEALANTKWAIFHGGYHIFEPPADATPLAPLTPDDTVQTAHFICFKGAAIAASRDYLKKMLARPEGHPDGGPMHVDGAYNWIRRAYPDFAAYVANPPLGFQRSSRSDIADTPWFDRIPGMASAANFIRRLKKRAEQ